MTIGALLGAAFFALAAYVGTLCGNAMAERIERFDDGPPPGVPPVAVIVAAAAAIGAVVVTRSGEPLQILPIALVCAALAAVWCCDARTGIVPDVLTLPPLAAILAFSAWEHAWWIPASALIVFIPFAAAAMLSRGLGMGWGDVKLAALGGAVLGAELSLVSFMLACAAAVVVNYVVQRKSGAIALGPYLAGAIALAIPFGMFR